MHQMDTSREDLLEAFMSIWLKFKDKFLELKKGDSTLGAQKKIAKIDSILRSIDTKDLSPQAVEILERMKADSKEAAKLLSAVTNEKMDSLNQDLSNKIKEFNELEVSDPHVNSIKNSTVINQPELTDEQKVTLEKIIREQFNLLDEKEKQDYPKDFEIDFSGSKALLKLNSISEPGYSGFRIEADVSKNELTVGGWYTTESKGSWVHEDYIKEKFELTDLMQQGNTVMEQSELTDEQLNMLEKLALTSDYSLIKERLKLEPLFEEYKVGELLFKGINASGVDKDHYHILIPPKDSNVNKPIHLSLNYETGEMIVKRHMDERPSWTADEIKRFNIFDKVNENEQEKNLIRTQEQEHDKPNENGMER